VREHRHEDVDLRLAEQVGRLGHVPGDRLLLGSRFGGHALYIKDNRLHYANNYVGITAQTVVATEDIPTGENLILSASFEKTGQEPLASTGTLTLFHGDTKVGQAEIKTQLGTYDLALPGLYVGRQEGEPITDDYPGEAPHNFTGGTIQRIAIGEPYEDLEREAERMLRRE
jgi:arylsulfatase